MNQIVRWVNPLPWMRDTDSFHRKGSQPGVRQHDVPRSLETKLTSPDSSAQLTPQQVKAGSLVGLLGSSPSHMEAGWILSFGRSLFLMVLLSVVCVHMSHRERGGQRTIVESLLSFYPWVLKIKLLLSGLYSKHLYLLSLLIHP